MLPPPQYTLRAKVIQANELIGTELASMAPETSWVTIIDIRCASKPLEYTQAALIYTIRRMSIASDARMIVSDTKNVFALECISPEQLPFKLLDRNTYETKHSELGLAPAGDNICILTLQPPTINCQRQMENICQPLSYHHDLMPHAIIDGNLVVAIGCRTEKFT